MGTLTLCHQHFIATEIPFHGEPNHFELMWIIDGHIKPCSCINAITVLIHSSKAIQETSINQLFLFACLSRMNINTALTKPLM